MLKDPDMTWSGQFPYDVLAAATITPASTIHQIANTSLDLIDDDNIPEAHEAIRLLRNVPSRLFYDFFFYQTSIVAKGLPETKEDK